MEVKMNEELASRIKRQEFQRMMAKKLGLADNTIDPDKNRVMDPRLTPKKEMKENEQKKK